MSADRHLKRSPGRTDFGLLEREAELDTLSAAVESLQRGMSTLVTIESPAGTGKSSLLTAAGAVAAEAQIPAVQISGTRLEQSYPYGLTTQLLERVGARFSDPGPHRSPGDRQASMALQLNGQADDAEPDSLPEFRMLRAHLDQLRGLLTGPGTLGGRPLTVLVDDAQLGDQESLRLLAYVAERIGVLPLPLLLVVAIRTGAGAGNGLAMASVKRAAHIRLRPSKLSEGGVVQVVRHRLARSDHSLCVEAMRLTDGNPFLLTEHLAGLSPGPEQSTPESPPSPGALLTERLVDWVAWRLPPELPELRMVASALAVFEQPPTISQVAHVAQLAPDTIIRVADQMAARDILRSGAPLTFTQPLVREAVRRLSSPLQAGQLHGLAATALLEDHFDLHGIASHLLASPPLHDERAVAALRSAAAVSKDPAWILRLLRRALEEMPTGELRAALLTELGAAESRVGITTFADRFDQARRSAPPGRARAEIALAAADNLVAAGRYREAIVAAEDGLTEAHGHDQTLRRELQAAYVAAASTTTGSASTREDLIDLIHAFPDTPSPGQRVALAYWAARNSVAGAERKLVRRDVDRAWSDGAFVEANADAGVTSVMLSVALLLTDDLERLVEICDEIGAPDSELEAPEVQSTWAHASALLIQGRVTDALARIENASTEPATSALHGAAIATAIACHVEQGNLEQAEACLEALANVDGGSAVDHMLRLAAGAQLRLAQHRPREALAGALQLAEVAEERFGTVSSVAVPWRALAARAHLGIGDTARAAELAQSDLVEARRVGATRVEIRSLRILGLATGGREGLQRLREAVVVGEQSPPRLEYAYALVDLGAALRRANRRGEARVPLRTGREIAVRDGATVLAERARTELLSAGGRPRNVASSGMDSLTPSQLRVVEFAGQGMTTRQIAETLFVTPKTVEFHLRHAYRKLNVSSRADLSELLSRVPRDQSASDGRAVSGD